MPLDASTLVSKLLENQRLVSLLAVDPYGNPAIYQLLSPEAEIFPRLIVLEDDREYTRFADDVPLEERIRFRLDIYARENILHQVNSALHGAMRQLGFRRAGQVEDGYLPDLDIYVKSASYEIHELLPTMWEEA
jgi:hypothetical protein